MKGAKAIKGGLEFCTTLSQIAVIALRSQTVRIEPTSLTGEVCPTRHMNLISYKSELTTARETLTMYSQKHVRLYILDLSPSLCPGLWGRKGGHKLLNFKFTLTSPYDTFFLEDEFKYFFTISSKCNRYSE